MLDREFIFQMIKTISKEFKNTDPDFASQLDRLIENPDVDLNYLKSQLAKISSDKKTELPPSVIETINSLGNGINVLIQKEEDHKILEETSQQQEQLVQEQIDINRQIEEGKKEEAQAVAEQQIEEQKLEEVEEKTEEEIKEEVSENVDSVDEVQTTESATIEMKPTDSVEDVANHLLVLAENGILATAIINGMRVSNDKFSSLDQFKEGYYQYQLSNLLQKYNEKAATRAPGEHTDMAIYTPEGEDNKRVVVLGNVGNEGLNETNSVTFEFIDGKDFDQYLMKDLIEAFVVDGQEIKSVEDEQNMVRGTAVTNNGPDGTDRYRYFATMSNDNRLALNMASSSIDQAKVYINGTRINDYKQEDIDQIEQAEQNGIEREKATQKVLKMSMPSSNGFVSGLGIGAVVGVSIVGNLLVLYLLKIIG